MLTLFCFLSMLSLSQEEPVRVTIGMENPERHYYQITTTFPASASEERILKMAVWTPGSYKIRDYARNLESFAATTTDGQPLSWHKSDKSTWVVKAPPGAPFTVSYEIFSYEFTVRTSYLDSFTGFINPASALIYEPVLAGSSFEISVETPDGWSVASPLQELAGNRFKAANWDVLVDSPFEFGELRRHEFVVRGIPHYWIIAGDVNMNEPEMLKSMQKVGDVVHDIFGGFPFSRYYYLTNFHLEGAGGGLEHANSTMINGSSLSLRTSKGWDRFLGTVLHEYIHAWNVKAIHDTVLGPFDYQTEIYTELLWLHEGWTSYYTRFLMRRAELIEEKAFLKKVADDTDYYLRTPGIDRQSLADSSFNAWIHQYQPGPASRNARISYYGAGAMSGMALDLMIRHKTRNKASLDDVMRRLYTDFAQQGRGITLEDVDRVITEVGGSGVENFIEEYIMAAKPLPLETCLGYAGLKLVYQDEKKKDDKKDVKPHAPNPKVSLGINTRNRDQAVFIRFVRRDGAGWKAGLALDDEILAINQRRVLSDNFDRVLSWSRPGDEVNITLSRAGRIITVPVKLDAGPKKLVLEPVEEQGSLQKSIYTALFSLKEPSEEEKESEPNEQE